MSNGKIWERVNTHFADNLTDRLIDIQIPNEVMDALYIPIDGKVFISDGGSLTAKLELDNSNGGRELDLSFRVDGDYPTQGWWETKTGLVERTMKAVPNDVLNYLGLGFADDQINIKYTVNTSTWSATLEKVSVI